MISDHVAAEKANLRAAHFNALRRNASISNNGLEEKMLRLAEQQHLDAGHSRQCLAAGQLRLDGSADFCEDSRPRHDLVAPVRQDG